MSLPTIQRKPWRPAPRTPTCPRCGQPFTDAMHEAVHYRLWHSALVLADAPTRGRTA